MICKHCGLDKPLEEFYKDGYGRRGQRYRPECKQCTNSIKSHLNYVGRATTIVAHRFADDDPSVEVVEGVLHERV